MPPQSGGISEASSFAGPCKVSRSTISNYLAVLEVTYVVHVLRPFTSHRPTEIVSAPKVYAFDTGFVCYYRGWEKLRRDDMCALWEHFVLNEIFARTQTRRVSYWRDKQRHELDLILAKGKNEPMVIECKWTDAEFDPANLMVFRRLYSTGLNFVVASDIKRAYSRSYADVEVRFVSLEGVIKDMQTS